MARERDEKSIFLEALSLPPEQRDAFLKTACPDEATRLRIEALLRHHGEAADAFLSESTLGDATQSLGVANIDEFRIIRRLGEGGMGVVYLAEDTTLGRLVAVKVLGTHLIGSERALSRFREEARSAAALRHPGIVPVFKFGQSGEEYYIVTEYVEGRTFADLIQTRRAGAKDRTDAQAVRTWQRRVADIVARIADALDCAHRARIVHRDVKPSNILIDKDGTPRLTDFGIAKHLADDKTLTQTAVIGSCHYMSPEQASVSNTAVDERSDVFSLGVILYESLALRRPFEGENVSQVLKAVIECDPPRLRSLDHRVPKDLETICHKALEKWPAQRYQTASHIAADLRCFLNDQPILATPPGLWRRARRWSSAHRLGVATGAAALLLLVATGLGWSLKSARDERLAWLSVTADAGAYSAYYQMVDPATFDLDRHAHPLGTTPINDVRLPPGQYRLTIVAPNQREFAEVNAVLLDPGRQNKMLVVVHDTPAGASEAGDSRMATGAGAIRHAVVASAADVAPTAMWQVPAGEYPCGSMDDPLPSLHRRVVKLPGFFIDRKAVSNREYKQFVDATGHRKPRHWIDYEYDKSLADRPVMSVTVEDAEAYARWRGKRLPTISEWQAATRGQTGRHYPWGDSLAGAPRGATSQRVEPGADQTRVDRALYENYRRGTVNTDVADPASGTDELLQIFGNVRELTANLDFPRRDGIAMGRSWDEFASATTLADPKTFPFDTYSYKHGFRCAKSATVPNVVESP